MLMLPEMPAPLLVGGAAQPDLLPALRLGVPQTRVVVDQGDAGVRVPIRAGQAIAARLDAATPFNRVGGYFGYATEPSPANIITASSAITLTLLRDSPNGPVVAEQRFDGVRERAWIDLPISQQPAGVYYLKATAARGEAAWFAQSVSTHIASSSIPTVTTQLHLPLAQSGNILNLGGIPLNVATMPILLNQSMSLTIGTPVTTIYVLGGTSSYDHGTGWWRDYEVQQDGSDRQFVGDTAGTFTVEYTDGTRDEVPLMFGLNLWWFNHWDNPDLGGPFLEPFADNQQARTALDASLQMLDVMPQEGGHYLWAYRPRPKPISKITISDNSQKQGYPYIAAITVEEGNSPALNPELRTWITQHALTPDGIAAQTYLPAIEGVQRFLYSFADDWQAGRIQVSPPPTTTVSAGKDQVPVIRATGTLTADVLSNIWYYTVKDMLTKVDPNGFLRASTPDAPNWSGYQGIGTWRNALGPYANQSWSRDAGRVLLEMIRMGLLERADAGIRYADSHLYDLPQKGVKRDGVLLPPHWTTIINDPLLLDNDKRGDGNQENDGHGLILLAHYTYWEASGRDKAWLHDRWGPIRDATDWFVWQLDNPAISRAKGDVLYTESEASADGGYDTYSNSIALACLEAGVTMAEAEGDTAAAQRWRNAAQRLHAGMLARLTVNDPQFGRCWVAVGWTWAYADESLGPLLIAADSGVMDSEFHTITQNTYRRQIAQPNGFAAPRVMGYGQSFITQAALLLDDQTGIDATLTNLAKFTYFAGKDPYIVPEGVALHPSGKYWYRTNDLGNAAHEAEAIKALALVAGIDAPGKRVVPHLPDGWQELTVENWPLGSGARLSYTLHRDGNALLMDGMVSDPSVKLKVRLGPFPAGSQAQIQLNGTQVPALQTEESGGSRWYWLEVMGHFTIRIE